MAADESMDERLNHYWATYLLLLRWPWCFVLGILVGIGLFFWFLFPIAPEWMQRAAPMIPADRWGRLLGIYTFTMVFNHVIIHPSLLGMRRLFGIRRTAGETPWPPVFVGLCEAVLYPTSFLFGKPEFIGVWLAIKAAGNWKLWQVDVEGRIRFQLFLIGNALSILIGFLSFGLMKALVLDPF